MDKKVKWFLLVIGVFYFLLGLIAFYNAVKYTETAGILWFSYVSFFLIGIGILTRNSYLIGSQLNIIIIPYIVWNIDFIYVLFTGNSLWGITNYFFTQRPLIAQVVTAQHIFTIPISLLTIYLIKLKRKDFWKFSFAQITILFFIIRVIGSQEENVNCVFSNCLPFYMPLAIYSVLWFVFYGIMIFLTTLFLTKIKMFNEK